MDKYANAIHDEHDAEISSQTYEQRQQYARYLLFLKSSDICKHDINNETNFVHREMI